MRREQREKGEKEGGEWKKRKEREKRRGEDSGYASREVLIAVNVCIWIEVPISSG